jgi:hypothetical protein
MLRVLANAPTWGISQKKNTDMNILLKKVKTTLIFKFKNIENQNKLLWKCQ